MTKFNTFFLLFLFLSLTVFSQKKNTKIINPPGTIKLSKSKYIDVAPVDNIMFKEYLDTKKALPISEIDSILDNANNYGLDKFDYLDQKFYHSKIDSFLSNDENDYSNHPKFEKYPVLNITFSEAEAYCQWRTKMVLLRYAMVSKTKKERQKYSQNLLYRLPTNREFTSALEIFGYSKKPKNRDRSINVSPYRLNYDKNLKKSIFIKNNLSEFTLDSLPNGNNWKDQKTFINANDYTGFRCICEILE